jgi:hypothetical protein
VYGGAGGGFGGSSGESGIVGMSRSVTDSTLVFIFTVLLVYV